MTDVGSIYQFSDRRTLSEVFAIVRIVNMKTLVNKTLIHKLLKLIKVVIYATLRLGVILFISELHGH